MNPDQTYQPPRTLDESIERRATWTPATRFNPTPLLMTATLQTIEAATLLGAVRAAYGLDVFDSTITLEVEPTTEDA